MAEPESLKEIVASADEARRALFELELELQKKVDDLDFRAFKEDRSLSEDEKETRTQLRASQTEVREAHVELAYVTLSRLDDSAEVQRLQAGIDRINKGLSDDIQRLKRMEDIAEKVARVADTVAKITEKIATKAADILV